jgi:urocanate hydratase
MTARTPGNVCRPIVPIIVTVGNRLMETYALMDTGANCDAIMPFLVRELDIQIRTEPRNLVVFGGEKTALRMCDLADFTVASFVSEVLFSVSK